MPDRSTRRGAVHTACPLSLPKPSSLHGRAERPVDGLLTTGRALPPAN